MTVSRLLTAFGGRPGFWPACRGLMALLGILCCAEVHACSIPVFRYALEHWAPDSYRALVFHQGPLNQEDAARVEELQRRSETANLKISLIDVSEPLDEPSQRVWSLHMDSPLPLLALHAPSSVAPGPLVWKGPLSEVQPEGVVASPARVELVRSLESGVSAVWLLIEAPESQHNDQLFELINSELRRLEETLMLPPIEEADLAELSGSPAELTIQFASQRINPESEAEQLFVEMLLATEPDLKFLHASGSPILIPVFGRGRALYALIGDGISPQLIEETGRFLTGACQCTVKLQNPGVDLLLTAGWETHVAPQEPRAPEYVAIPPKVVQESAFSAGGGGNGANTLTLAQSGSGELSGEASSDHDLPETSDRSAESPPESDPQRTPPPESQEGAVPSEEESAAEEESIEPPLSRSRSAWLLLIAGMAVIVWAVVHRHRA